MKPSQKPIKVDEKDTVTNRQKKLQYYVDDPNNVVKDFERYVRSKYGFTKGIIGKEIIEAFENHLTLKRFGAYKKRSLDIFTFDGPAHKHLKNPHEVLLRCLEDRYNEGEAIKFRDIQDIIRNEFEFGDRRTHKSYVDILRSSAFLIQPDGVKDYDYYFFKEMPKAEDGRVKHVVDVQTQLIFPGNKIYPVLPPVGRKVTIEGLRELSPLKPSDVETGLKQLVENGILRHKGIGQFVRVK